MSMFAGVIVLDGQRLLLAELCGKLVGALSRHPGDQPVVRRGAGYLFAQVALPGATHDCSYSDASGITLLAGSPLFADSTTAQGDAQRLHMALQRTDHATLRQARGSYCALHWDARSNRPLLLADKLGLRPLYFGIEQGLFFFSTALRVLETLGALTQRMDIQGVTEIACYGYPLAARSPYEAVRTIEAGEIVQGLPDGLRSQRYWKWDELPASHVQREELPRAIFEAFTAAIERRLDGQQIAVAGLSGGLDSRCVVAGLQSRGVRVHTLNFAPSGSEDLALGKLAAQALGTQHFEFPVGPLDFWDRMQAAHQAWIQSTPHENLPPNPHRLWSGDGGSCGLGHIYLNEQIIMLMRAGDDEGAIGAYLQLNRIDLPRKLLARDARGRLIEYLRSGVRLELQRLKGADPTRRMHLYLMLNSQRRLLANHYENIDLRRFELVTPFFDSDLLQLVLTSPIEGFLKHRFYNRWLDEFPREVRDVAWQAYPGHAKCPVPKPAGLRTQWENWYDQHDSREIKRRELALADQVLSDARLPKHLLNRRVLWLARRLTGLGLGDYGHVFRFAATFARYSRPN